VNLGSLDRRCKLCGTALVASRDTGDQCLWCRVRSKDDPDQLQAEATVARLLKSVFPHGIEP
jgi:hypothetical protein